MTRAVRAKVEPLVIHPEGLSGLFEVCDMISHDAGAGAGHKGYLLPDVMPLTARTWSGFLGNLTKEDRETFAIGEQSEIEQIIAATPALASCHRTLNRWFNEGCACACSKL